MRPLPILVGILLALGAVEGLAWWWMHPKPSGQGEPVLVYRPEVGLNRRAGRDVASGAESQGAAEDGGQETEERGSEVRRQEEAKAPAQSTPSTFDVGSSKFDVPSSSPISDSQRFSVSASTSITPLPEIYDKAAPMLRCSSGQVLHAQLDNTLGLHLAFFEWDGTDTGSVLEAFRHMPEACMGAIGMKLVSKEKPISYSVGAETLLFDHTLFREPGQTGHSLLPGPLVHAFRAVWVSGLSLADARQGLGGEEFNRLRTIRLKSALTRYRPSHARVIQGAVRGAPNSASAWQAFEQTMLADLRMETR